MDTSIGIQGFGQYDAARKGLERLVEEFDYAKDFPLGHQLISPLDGPWTKNQWSAFIEKNSKVGADWQRFEILPGEDLCSRFFGIGSVDSFIRLANMGMELLGKLSQMRKDGTAIMPSGLTLRLPSCGDHHGWVQLLYDTAKCYSTAVLYAEAGYWNKTGQFDGDDADPACPSFEELRYDLHGSSAEAIRLWLNPIEDTFCGDYITETPIYLPPEPEMNGPCLVLNQAKVSRVCLEIF